MTDMDKWVAFLAEFKIDVRAIEKPDTRALVIEAREEADGNVIASEGWQLLIEFEDDGSFLSIGN